MRISKSIAVMASLNLLLTLQSLELQCAEGAGRSKTVQGLDDLSLAKNLDKGISSFDDYAPIERLIEQGADLGVVKNDERLSMLVKVAKKAVLCNRREILQRLLQAKIFDQTCRDELLLLAADTGKRSAMSILLKNGADLCAQDSDGNTLLHLYTQNSYKEPVPYQALLRLIVHENALTLQNKQGKTPFSLLEEVERSKKWQQYYYALPMMHQYTFTKNDYSLLQALLLDRKRLLEGRDIHDASKLLFIPDAIEAVLPFSNLMYVSKNGQTALALVDSDTNVGQMIVEAAWSHCKKNNIIAVNGNPSLAKKRQLMLDHIHQDSRLCRPQ